jgi:hypothetical protein
MGSIKRLDSRELQMLEPFVVRIVENRIVLDRVGCKN